MKLFFISAFITSLVAMPANADWANTTWGETLPRLQEKYPEGRTIGDGITDVESIYGQPRFVINYPVPFTEGKAFLLFKLDDQNNEILSSVALRPNTDPEALVSIKSALEERYGTPFATHSTKDSSCQRQSTKWRDDENNYFVSLRLRQCELGNEAYIFYSPMNIAKEIGL